MTGRWEKEGRGGKKKGEKGSMIGGERREGGKQKGWIIKVERR